MQSGIAYDERGTRGWRTELKSQDQICIYQVPRAPNHVLPDKNAHDEISPNASLLHFRVLALTTLSRGLGNIACGHATHYTTS